MKLPLIGEVGGSFEAGKGSSATATSGTQSTKTILSQEAVNKIIADVLGGDQGLASLASGENVSGLSGTSVKSMLAADLTTKLAGEIAKLTGETVTTMDQQQNTSTSSKKGGLKTVICTELERQGKLDTALYLAGTSHFMSLSEQTVRGYRVWANRVVPLMQKSERLSNSLVPIVTARYEHITGARPNFLGALTVYVGQPICWIIGAFVPQELQYGHN